MALLHGVLTCATAYNNAETTIYSIHGSSCRTQAGGKGKLVLQYRNRKHNTGDAFGMTVNLSIQSAPALGILLDLPLGVFMWVAVLRFLLTIFIKEDSRVLPMRLLVSLTTPVIAATRPLTPAWVINRIAPLYTAVILLILRYYLLPLVIGYDVLSFSNMPFEGMVLSVYFDFMPVG